ncbi:MAG: monothiol glutaredoxin [Planctomycetota bacterium]|jgi:monothiol glutaredoxin
MWTSEQVKNVIESNTLVIFGKGTKFEPMCGFTHRAIEIYNTLGKPFEVVNIFEDESIRGALTGHTNWPTTPQCFVAGELLGGSDIVDEMLNSGDLQKKVDAAFAGAESN